MRRGGIILILLTVLCSIRAFSQDPHFSQFYAAPTFMSPSLAGSTGGTRLIANYRNQWPGISNTYKTYAFSTDLYVNRFKSGFGLLLLSDAAGTAELKTSLVGFQYSYRVRAGENWQFIPGLQFTVGQKSLDPSKLDFPGDLGDGSIGIGDAYLTDTKATYVDFATSMFLFSPKFWTGVTIDHMLQPNYSFMGEETELPFKVVAFGGMNLWKERARRVDTPRRASFVYRYEHQKNFKQLDLGAYLYNKFLDFGLWYRGIPVFNNDVGNVLDNDALVFLIGVTWKSFRLGYSYDIQLNSLAAHGAGAHEISLTYEIGELFGCGTKYLDCFTKRAGHKFTKSRPRKMEIF